MKDRENPATSRVAAAEMILKFGWGSPTGHG
jgi:hypothetical protein